MSTGSHSEEGSRGERRDSTDPKTRGLSIEYCFSYTVFTTEESRDRERHEYRPLWDESREVYHPAPRVVPVKGPFGKVGTVSVVAVSVGAGLDDERQNDLLGEQKPKK